MADQRCAAAWLYALRLVAESRTFTGHRHDQQGSGKTMPRQKQHPRIQNLIGSKPDRLRKRAGGRGKSILHFGLPATELFSKHPILLAKIFNDLQLAVVHPPGDGDQQKSEWVEHSLRIQNPLSRPPSRSSEISHLHADPVFGPYAILEK